MGPLIEHKTHWPGALTAIARLADVADAPAVALEADALANRIEEGRFFLACVGQHKRGKSTLLNALIGAPLLPVGVIPLTSVVTVVRHGLVGRARVRMQDGSWHEVDPSELRAYVTEDGNPENVKRVSGAEVFAPHPMLASGLCLVDTPGIGSVFEQNTSTTRGLVPHIDAAIAVLGVDPPISGDELALVVEMAQHVRHVFFVINKVDRIPQDHLEEAIRFTERIVTERLGGSLRRIYRVSATEPLTGAHSDDWNALVDAIATVASESGAELVRDAASRGFARLVTGLKREFAERRGALLRPLAESERRVEALRRYVEDALRSLDDLQPLFSAEHAKLSSTLLALREGFLARSRSLAREELNRRVRGQHGLRTAALRREAVLDAQHVAYEWLDRLRVEVADKGESAYRAATERFAELAGESVRRLAAADEPSRLDVPAASDFDLTVRVPPRIPYTDLLPMTSPSPQRWVLEAVLPSFLLRSSIERLADRYLSTLLETNSARIVNDFGDRAHESEARLQAEVRQRLVALTASAERALAVARDRIAWGQSAVMAELAKLDGLCSELEAIVASASSRTDSGDMRRA